jgi:predicted CopG family antitoxin
MGSEDTSIRIKVDTWRRLRSRKGPGESFDDVINEILDEAGSPDAEHLAD